MENKNSRHTLNAIIWHDVMVGAYLLSVIAACGFVLRLMYSRHNAKFAMKSDAQNKFAPRPNYKNGVPYRFVYNDSAKRYWLDQGYLDLPCMSNNIIEFRDSVFRAKREHNVNGR